MKVVKGLPPNIDEIRTFLDPTPEMFFTYGDTIYGPEKPPEDVVFHEEVHRLQQAKVGGPDAWWQKYRNPDFRLQQEVEAYRAQLRWLYSRMVQPYRYSALVALARALRSPSYGFRVTESTALRLLA